jgi:cytochrome c553
MTAPTEARSLHDSRAVFALSALLFSFATTSRPAEPANKPTFTRDVAPLVAKYCARCHGAVKPKGGIALVKDADDVAVLKNRALWEKVADNLRSGDMPPEGAKRPTAAEMEVWSRWIDVLALSSNCTGPKDPGRVTIRRLNRVEYNNTIRDLVGVKFQPAKDFPADDVGYGFDNIGDVLSLPPLLMEKYLAAAEKIVDEAFKIPELRRRLMPRDGRERGAHYQNLKQFATRAWRRPATDEETRRLMRFVQLAREQGDNPTVGVKTAFQAVLASPHFLFRVELDGQPGVLATGGSPRKTPVADAPRLPLPPVAGAPGSAEPIDQYQLASRLSYFLWSSMPDDELFKLVREKKLREPGVIAAQVKRMLRDQKARALADNFASQWLNIRSLPTFSPDPKRFPAFNAELRQDMIRETEMFFLHVLREGCSILDFLDADYTFVNERLARHYGLSGVKGVSFRKVSVAGTPRGGVLTHASILAVTSNPTRTSPVKRGKWILENILGTPPPPPPPDVDELKEDGEAKGTLRQQMEMHRKNPTCASCHQRMDPLGFGFENFDAIGAWRTKDGGQQIDAGGVLPDGSAFKGPAELRKILLQKKDLFANCLTEKLLTYALGRGMERSDRCHVEAIVRKIAKEDYKLTGLIVEIVESDPFQKRRARGAPK